MSQKPPLLQRVGRGFAAFFTHDVALKRSATGVQVVLQDAPPSTPHPVTREDQAVRREAQELALLRKELAELLDELPHTRRTLKHLVFVEHAIGKHGFKALHKLPVDVMQRALAQLEGLVTNWSPVGLASLRSKLAVAIIDRDHHNAQGEDDVYRTAAVIDTMPVVSAVEVTESNDDDALAAAYAALGHLAPAAVEVQGELDSPSARVIEREATRPGQPGGASKALKLREPVV